MSRPLIVPVIDILDGVVVRGVAGRRNEYRPIESCLTDKTDVLSVATAFREHFQAETLYIADLDGIMRGQPNFDDLKRLSSEGFHTLVDAGVSRVEHAKAVSNTNCEAVIAGLETCPDPGFLTELVQTFGADRVIFSLDMKQGALLGDLKKWNSSCSFEVAAESIALGINRLIVLDLAQVGVGSGLSTLSLCERLLNHDSQLRLITGGGIRDNADIDALENVNLEGVLVASALHNGNIEKSITENR